MSVSEHKVFVVDDELSVRKSVSRLLKAAGFNVETFASASEFLQRGVEPSVSCLVLDIQMPELNGLELQRALAETDRCLPIIFITGHGDIPSSVRAMKTGATDFLTKPFHEKDLLDAIKRAHERSRQELLEKAEADEVRLRLATLTSREHEVLLQVLTGQLNKQIAATLGASEKTIKVHRGRVMHKMQVQSVADLVRLCEKAGIRVP
jgi:FixJ family two-component response regulator